MNVRKLLAPILVRPTTKIILIGIATGAASACIAYCVYTYKKRRSDEDFLKEQIKQLDAASELKPSSSEPFDGEELYRLAQRFQEGTRALFGEDFDRAVDYFFDAIIKSRHPLLLLDNIGTLTSPDVYHVLEERYEAFTSRTENSTMFFSA